jgi:hypothetical protein
MVVWNDEAGEPPVAGGNAVAHRPFAHLVDHGFTAALGHVMEGGGDEEARRGEPHRQLDLGHDRLRCA